MSKKVFSYTLVAKKKNYTGMITFATGIASLMIIVSLIGYSIYTKGQVPTSVAALGYISFLMALVGRSISRQVYLGDECAVRWIGMGYLVNLISCVFHIGMICIGIMAVIL